MNDHAAVKQQAALASIFASAALTVGKLVAGLLSGSLALLSEAMHGLLDTGATILTYFAVKAADKPADDEHHYGHGKIEAVAALAETGLLMALAVAVVIEAARRLFGAPAEIEATWLAFAVLIVSILVDFVRYRSLQRIATETKSDALAADALHFSSDLVASVLVLLGLVAAHFGFVRGDAVAAIGVALFIGVAGWRLGKQTVETLTDTAPAGLAERLRGAIDSVPGVIDVEAVRLRPAGAQVIGDVAVAVPRTMTLERVARVKEAVAAAIAQEAPEAALTVVTTPRALDEETVVERVLHAAGRRRLPVHHVTVQQIEGRISISLDLELDGRMSLGEAHEVASALEAAIRDEVGQEAEVDTHVEPLEVKELAGRDAPADRAAPIAAALAERAGTGPLSDVHSVRVRQTDAGLVVNYHCRAAPNLTVAAVHEAVDALDRKLRADFPEVIRVVGHAEPPKAAA